jgi:NAD(P)-dependent dehydrogenase (short-subunit alcohol dehydrogenase family)
VAKKVDRIDVVFNAIGFDSHQGTPLLELALEDFSFPIETWTRAQFLTARSAARRMVTKRSGVILMLSASPARMAIPLTGGFGVACAAIEGLSRTLAGELSPQGVRVVCLRPHRIGDTLPMAPEFPKMERESFRELLEDGPSSNGCPRLPRWPKQRRSWRRIAPGRSPAQSQISPVVQASIDRAVRRPLTTEAACMRKRKE